MGRCHQEDLTVGCTRAGRKARRGQRAIRALCLCVACGPWSERRLRWPFVPFPSGLSCNCQVCVIERDMSKAFHLQSPPNARLLCLPVLCPPLDGWGLPRPWSHMLFRPLRLILLPSQPSSDIILRWVLWRSLQPAVPSTAFRRVCHCPQGSGQGACWSCAWHPASPGSELWACVTAAATLLLQGTGPCSPFTPPWLWEARMTEWQSAGHVQSHPGRSNARS